MVDVTGVLLVVDAELVVVATDVDEDDVVEVDVVVVVEVCCGVTVRVKVP